MSHRKAVLCLVLLCLTLTLLAGCGGGESRLPDYDYRIDIAHYEDAIMQRSDQYLLLANKQNPLGATYAPEALCALDVSLTLYGKEIQLESNAALAAEALIRELWARGYDDIVVTSGYRSYSYQQSLFYTYLEKEKTNHPDWSDAEAEACVLTYSARPGTSEHQTGLCVDLISTSYVSLDETFAQNPAYAWLCENAHYFGFVLRYPQGKADVVGYGYEPWHYRFVGVKAATEMHESGLVLEEYVGR